MTNGEKFKEVFKISQVDEGQLYAFAWLPNHNAAEISIEWWNAEYKEPTTKNDLALIHTWGLDEGIRCAMCINSIKSDRGCDGGCVVNNAMYKKVMDVIENHIVDTDKMVELTTKNNLGVDKEQLKTMIRGLTKWYVKRDNTEVGKPNTAVGLLYDDVMFGIDRLPSVTPQEPRIITCKDCKYYRNKGNKRSYCTKRLNVDSVTDRYREPNFYCADAVLREVVEE